MPTSASVYSGIADAISAIRISTGYLIDINTPLLKSHPNNHVADADVQLYPKGYMYPDGNTYETRPGNRITKKQRYTLVMFCMVAAQANPADSAAMLDSMLDNLTASLEKLFLENPQIAGCRQVLLTDTDDDRGNSATCGTLVCTITAEHELTF